jgi:hypothetical protein
MSLESDAVALVAKGKAAVESELTNIEAALAAAKAVAEQKGAALLSALNSHVQTHVAEVTAAQNLSARAAALVPSAPSAVTVGSSAPATTLTTSSALSNAEGKLTTALKAIGWKVPVVSVSGLSALWYWAHTVHHWL